jgi:hypothetical protein
MDYDYSVCLVLKTTAFSLTDIIAVLSWPKNWTIENVSINFSLKTVHLVAWQAFKNAWRPGCLNFSKRDDRKGLTKHMEKIFSIKKPNAFLSMKQKCIKLKTVNPCLFSNTLWKFHAFERNVKIESIVYM